MLGRAGAPRHHAGMRLILVVPDWDRPAPWSVLQRSGMRRRPYISKAYTGHRPKGSIRALFHATHR